MIEDFEFSPDFFREISRIQNLLDELNHFWAKELCDKIFKQIEAKSTPISERLHITNILIKIWENHLKTLVTDLYANWPLIYDAYNIIFEMFSTINDTNRIAEIGIRLAKIFDKINFTENENIANFLESLAILTYKSKDLRKSLELFFLSIYFSKNYFQTPFSEDVINKFGSILQRLSPNQRVVLLNSFLSNIFSSFFTNTNILFTDFIEKIYRISFQNFGTVLNKSLQQIMQNPLNFQENLELLKKTIDYLQMMKEDAWAFSIVKIFCNQLKKQNLQKEIEDYLDHFIEKSFKHGGYQIAFFAYSYLDNIKRTKNTRFNIQIIKIWADAGRKFRKLTDKSFFVSAMKKFRNLLKLPENSHQFQDFSYAFNEYYRLIRGHIFINEEEFWWVAFHRSVFEEGFKDIAKICAEKLHILDLPIYDYIIKEEIPQTTKKINDLVDSKKQVDIAGMKPSKIVIKIRIPAKKEIKIYSEIFYTSGFTKPELLKIDELWVESQLLKLYMELPFQTSKSQPNVINSLNQVQFGKLAYLFLPQELRIFFSQLNLRSDHVPEVSIIMDDPSFPFEMLHDQNSPLGTKFAFGYRFKEPKLTPEKIIIAKNSGEHDELKFMVLSIGDFNSTFPQNWNEFDKKYVPIFPFPESLKQLTFIKHKINNLQNLVEKSTILKSDICTFQTIEQEITTGLYNIIYISSNLFYLEENPIKSYFLTPDDQVISIQDIIEMLSFAQKHNEIQGIPYFKPLLIFDGRVIDKSNNIVPRSFIQMSKISKSLDTRDILGILSRISNEFDEILELFLGEFINRLLLNESIGSALLKANKQLFNTVKSLEKFEENDLALLQLLQETHYVFFSGNPFRKLE